MHTYLCTHIQTPAGYSANSLHRTISNPQPSPTTFALVIFWPQASIRVTLALLGSLCSSRVKSLKPELKSKKMEVRKTTRAEEGTVFPSFIYRNVDPNDLFIVNVR